MAGRVEGKVAIVSGAAGGIGAAAARRLAAEGADVVLGDVAEARVKAVADEIGQNARGFGLDVTDPSSWAEAVALAEREFGTVTVLLNNAGVLRFGPIDKAEDADLDLLLNVNVKGVWHGIRAVTPGMRDAGGGSIVNTSSVEGMGGGRAVAAYTASKFAVRGLTKAASIDLIRYGIRVNSIHPGAIKTPMVASAIDTNMGRKDAVAEPPPFDEDMAKIVGDMVPMQRMGEPEEVANLMLYLASDESSYSTGAEFVVDGGAVSTSGFGH